MKEKGRAGRSGFTLVELMIVLAIIAIIAAFAIPNLMRSRMGANEAGAIGTLRTLITAQSTYMNRHNSYGDLEDLNRAGLIEATVSGGEMQGYYFGTIESSRYAYIFGAVPVDKGRSGDKEFTATQAGTVYEAYVADHYAVTENDPLDWVPGEGGIPDIFTTTPESSDDWKPVGG